MALLNELRGLIEWMGWYLIPFIFVMSVIVFFHELGHYLVGRWCGVKIDAFSMGFGPELFARVDKHGTRWRLAAIPLGGYVKFHGDANAASSPDPEALVALPPSERTLTLAGQPLRNRAAVVAAGPIANFILAFVIFTAMFMAFGRAEHSARIGGVEAGSPAAQAGFQPGDVIKSINGQPVSSFQDLQQATMLSTGLPMTFVVTRAGGDKELTATPQIAVVDQGPLGKRRMGRLGLMSSRDPADVKYESCGPATCAAWGAEQVWFIVKATGAYVGGLFAGRESADSLSGPIAVSQIAGEMAKINPLQLFSLAALFSVSVGLMNLLPIPLLDGGHLLFYALEGLRGRPLSDRVQQIGLRVGIAFVALLVIFTTSHDILRLVGGN
ncbi:MAG: RIP metalloprotease [Hyphomicrobiales bacterium]|nr:RIP metalloprotease [Hyphomicrobiales bacterium]MBV8661531.1 RIP metalloprotease [Hyphomicrobiales bacterium]